jgi:4-diphosphocytidyl-2-C-methyl-D-erythritol kinase
MRQLLAPAKINLALVVGSLRENGKHEVATVLQRVSLFDRITLGRGEHLAVSGFADDTIVTEALRALAASAGVEPCWSVEMEKSIPVAAGLGGGSSDAAAALRLANELLPEPLSDGRLGELAATIGADVPFFLVDGPQLGTGDGTVLSSLDLPRDYWVVLIVPSDTVKASTADVYRSFDARGGAEGFAERREALLGSLAAVRAAGDLARLPANDLATSPLSQRLREAGAFRADVSGAGPCVYGLFADRQRANEAQLALRSEGQTWVVSPHQVGDAAGTVVSTVGA